jgi:DNA repair exonuclease SbcCD ATPase subunit
MPESAERMSKEVEGLRTRLRASVQAELEVREGMAEEEEGLLGSGTLDGLVGGEGGREGGVGGVMDYETLGTPAVWRAYMAEAAAAAAAAAAEGGSNSSSRVVLEEGLQLIEAWEASTGGGETLTPSAHTAAVTPTTAGGGSTRTVRLEFEKVKVVGYGPFLRAVEYPLGGRGLVLLRGKNMDDPGAESNAAGKSKLAMAAQWALTGEGDEKPVMDSKVADVAFDVLTRGRAAYAEVTLWGSVNGVPFQAVRKRGLKTNQLRFVLDGEDLTRQTSKDTQRAMEEALGLDMDFLSLAIFCGQHQMNGLLEATDVRLKERLSKIVRLGVWEDLKETAKVMAKGYVEQGMSAQTQVRVCELDLERQELEEAELLEMLSMDDSSSSSSSSGGAQLLGGTIRTLDQVEIELGSLSRQVEEARAAWKESMERREEWARGQAEVGQSAGIRRERLRSLQVGVEEDRRAVAGLEDRWDPSLYWAELQRWGVVGEEEVIDSTLGLAFAAHVPVEEWQEKVATVEVARAKCLAEIGAAGGDLRKVEGALDSLMTGGRREEGEEGVDGCPTCGRAWDEGGVDAKAKAIAHLEGEIAKCRLMLEEAEEKKPRLEKQKLVLTRIAEAHVQYLRDVRDWQALCQRIQARGQELAELQKEVAEGGGTPIWTEEEQVLQGQQQQEQPVDELAAREREFRTLQEQFNKLQDERPRLIQQAAELQAREREAAELRKRLAKKRGELTKAREVLEATRAIQTEQEEKARLFRELIEKFGMRGVQAFVLRGAVAQLERLANRFLAVLSEGGLRLGLSLDGEKIAKEVKVRGGDGVFHDRSLSHLSGGQWRRASLAALMAFRELSRLRSRVDCNLMVLDEVLNHLDGAGRARVGKLLRAMVQGGREDEDEEEGEEGGFEGHSTGIDTAIVILQDLAAFELEDTFDFVDEVVKEGDVSRVVLDERHEIHVQRQSQLLAFEEEGMEEEDDDDAAGSQNNGGGSGSLYVKEEEVWGVDAEVVVPPSVEDEQATAKARAKEKRKKQQQEQPETATSVVKGGWLDGLEEVAIK